MIKKVREVNGKCLRVVKKELIKREIDRERGREGENKREREGKWEGKRRKWVRNIKIERESKRDKKSECEWEKVRTNSSWITAAFLRRRNENIGITNKQKAFQN